ncbi:hypothetical protein ABF58_11835 [Enterobacter hormaechei subsp. steigerwaltii]|jgi:hypothetical protein|nr:hypothetical protein ECNIH4_18225 [Enterobacter cloacae]AKZ72195.1 hypothetical protein LI67_005470 [Enterobacter roggenkampii]KJM39442.1 hypothetical protein SS27_02455 [Enterobacter kobei]KJM56837.1 hypothetical protein SS23_18585 [Enterobacter hormaechei subsp. steigerwaltii]KJN35357.1 hypothetical protein SS14_04565 [Enterobacter bugandensis]OWS65404.1 hypothetical protein WM88_17675 [Enterobacter cloacae complex sp. ECNIH6]PRW24243.1 hypothetical protein CSC03_2125 [Enterobacter horma
MGQEQQWGNWFGTVNAMEFELNADNSAGERMTITCRDSNLIVSYSGSDKEPMDIPDNGQESMGININAVHYPLDEAAFIALKNTGNHGQIEITRMNKPVSHPFKTAGLRDALSDLNWEDCISH